MKKQIGLLTTPAAADLVAAAGGLVLAVGHGQGDGVPLGDVGIGVCGGFAGRGGAVTEGPVVGGDSTFGVTGGAAVEAATGVAGQPDLRAVGEAPRSSDVARGMIDVDLIGSSPSLYYNGNGYYQLVAMRFNSWSNTSLNVFIGYFRRASTRESRSTRSN